MYFKHGSVRNSAHDEEFFHFFEQYLEEAIKKLKEQGTINGIHDEEREYG
jgi:hypothetical protein